MIIPGIATKIGIGAITLAAIFVGGSTIYSSLVPNTFGDLLSKEGYKLLEEDSESWSTLIQKHKDNQSSSQYEKIFGLNLESTNEKEQFIKKCQDLWDTNLENKKENGEKEKIQKELKTWCVKDPEVLKNR